MQPENRPGSFRGDGESLGAISRTIHDVRSQHKIRAAEMREFMSIQSRDTRELGPFCVEIGNKGLVFLTPETEYSRVSYLYASSRGLYNLSFHLPYVNSTDIAFLKEADISKAAKWELDEVIYMSRDDEVTRNKLIDFHQRLIHAAAGNHASRWSLRLVERSKEAGGEKYTAIAMINVVGRTTLDNDEKVKVWAGDSDPNHFFKDTKLGVTVDEVDKNDEFNWVDARITASKKARQDWIDAQTNKAGGVTDFINKYDKDK